MKMRILAGILVAFAAAGLAFFYIIQPQAPTTLPAHKTNPVSNQKHLPTPPPALHVSIALGPAQKSPSPSPVSPEPEFEVSTTASPIRSSDLVVPPGARVPAVLMDGGSPDDSPQTRNIMNGLVEEFAQKIQEARLKHRNMDEAWEEAREEADDRYRFFFGFEAFNAATLEAAGEAAEESNSMPSPAP